MPYVPVLDEAAAVDLSAALRFGIYILRFRGRVVFIGKGAVPLELIAAHRNLDRKITAPWMPFRGIHFDAVSVLPSHPDRVAAELAALIDKYDPPGNRVPAPIPLSSPVRTLEGRRI